jgi:predicted nucleotidyltransferase
MPVRSLSSSVLKWPERETVEAAIRTWAEKMGREHDHLRRVGYFGSYARGHWGVGSDLDVLIVVSESRLPVETRAVEWDTTELPVPADVFVYTTGEWQTLIQEGRFGHALARETVWVYERNPSPFKG